MFIELIDALRCPRPHEDTWLVGAFDRLVDRDVRAGTLGCPVCHAEYPIRDGVVLFADTPPSAEIAPIGDPASEAMRLGALLNLVGDGGIVVLGGGWATLGAPLRELVNVELLLLDPPSAIAERARLSAIRAGGAVPLAAGSCRGIALDPGTATPGQLDGATRALRSRGRLVAPAGAPVPDGIRELARDAAVWVGEREDVSPVVALGRR